VVVNGWREFKIRPLADGVRASPYLDWAQATRFAYYGRSNWLPLLLELRGSPARLGTAEAFADFVLRAQAQPQEAPPWVRLVRVPAFFASAHAGRRKPGSPFIAVLARTAFVSSIRTDPMLSQCIAALELGATTAFSAKSRAQPLQAWTAPPGSPVPRVLLAVIDDGMAFAHDRLLDGNGGTRIESAFDQLQPLQPWYFGRQIEKRQPGSGIDDQMAACRRAGVVDEDEVYRRTAALDLSQPGQKPLLARSSHGAAVSDLAGGEARPNAQHPPLLAVQLPTATVADTSGATLGPQVLAALAWIVWRADQIHLGLPVIVNLSYGRNAGPHDGSSLFERQLDTFIACCGGSLRVVLPAGNAHLSRCHARFSLSDAEPSRTLHWRVLPDDGTENQLEIWLPPGAPNLELQVIAPDGQPTTPFGWGSGQQLLLHGRVVGQAEYHAPGSAGTRAMVHIALAPTADAEGLLPLAPAGCWRVVLSRRPGQPRVLGIDAWIQRDDTAPGYRRRGRPSYFDDPRYARFDDGGRWIESDTHRLTRGSVVKRAGTLNAIATGRRPVVVGGFRRSDGAVAAYSAAGPLVGPGRKPPSAHGPDALLPSEDDPALTGLLAAGTRSGAVVGLRGTSAAAPLAARWLAAQATAAGRSAIFNAAKLGDPGPNKPAAQRGGGGRLQQASGDRPRRREP
jgi:hypothetical protein